MPHTVTLVDGPLFQSLIKRWDTVAKHRTACLVACGAMALLVRVSLLPLYPVPVPSVHDESSYLLAAETFAAGRLTNPTPPLWVHFETFHELMQPSYMSMYPPGQGALLAIGIVLFGHPWWAVWLSVGVMCSALTWMLYEWFPPAWALLGGVLGVLQFAIAHYWMDSYWGGSLAAIGGCLTLGAYPRMIRRQRILDGVVAGIGLGVVANTRPYEMLSLGAVFAGALFLWLWRQPGGTRLRTAVVLGVPVLIAFAPFLAATLIEAKAVTGSAFETPHELRGRQVGVWPTFVFQRPRPIPIYHHEEMRKYYVEWQPAYEDARHWGTLRGLWPGIVQRASVARGCYLPERLYLPFALASFLALWSRRIRFLAVCVIAAFLGNGLVNALAPHYLAPVLGAMMALHLQLLRWVRACNLKVFAALLLLVCGLLGHRYYRLAGAPPNFATARLNMIHQLQADGRRHLVFVRYRPSHNLGNEWVFNGMDIPSQQVIWARSMSLEDDKKLATFVRDRVAWVLDADDAPPALRPWPSQ
jgi:hypothetical protein